MRCENRNLHTTFFFKNLTMDTLSKMLCESLKSLHPSLLFSIPLAIAYFFYPFYILKAAPVWACAVASYLQHTPYGNSITAGLLFGSFEDILLEMDDFYNINLFIPGLVCFLIGHLCYIRAFYQSPIQFLAKTVGIPLLSMYYGIVMYFLLSTVNAYMIAPVVIYALIIVLMVFFAFNRFLLSHYIPSATRYTSLLGCLWFLISDTILAFYTFYYDGIPGSHYLIMITYYLGQFCIATSTQFPLVIEEFDDVDLEEAINHGNDIFERENPIIQERRH